MNNTERKAAFSLAFIMTFRMLGLFMILPVFTLFAQQLAYSTPKLIGIALGIYGLTQACLQIPFGFLSDKIGRKKMIFVGLILFAAGSVIAALSHSIYGIIFGRALQGAGAVGSVIIALLADLTRENQRTKAMAIVGSSIGVAFALAMVVAPLLNVWIGVNGIFWLTAGLAFIGMAILFFTVPNPPISTVTEPMTRQRWRQILMDRKLVFLNVSIFIQHAILTATFIAVPVALQQSAKLVEAKQWLLYLPVLVVAYAIMVPFIIMAEKKGKLRAIFLGAVFSITLSQIGLVLFHTQLLSYAVMLLIFFTAFTLLEAILPSTVSKAVPPHTKGTAMGIYSTLQFLGIFVGGLVGGIVFGAFGTVGIFMFCTFLGLLWLLVSVKYRTML